MRYPDDDSAGVEVIGTGADALLLPALSSISTRQEMRPLAQRLDGRLRCTIRDWPGFGARPRPGIALSPDRMRRFLDTILGDDTGMPLVGIAAGHGATYLVEAARRRPGRFSHLVLVAPTWRGPLPTMLGDERASVCRRVKRAIELPVLGDLLYRVSVSRPVMARMMRAHVLGDANNLTPTLLDDKRAVTRQPNARFGTAAFISGGLDPVASRAAFLALFEGSLPPILVLRPSQAPRRSGAEMDALAATGRVTTAALPGALALHEEHPDAVAAAIRDFVSR